MPGLKIISINPVYHFLDNQWDKNFDAGDKEELKLGAQYIRQELRLVGIVKLTYWMNSLWREISGLVAFFVLQYSEKSAINLEASRLFGILKRSSFS